MTPETISRKKKIQTFVLEFLVFFEFMTFFKSLIFFYISRKILIIKKIEFFLNFSIKTHQ
jgi:hypothetical protein